MTVKKNVGLSNHTKSKLKSIGSITMKRLGYYTAIWNMLDSLEEKEQTQEV